MIFIKNKLYPFKNFNAITHFPLVFYKELTVTTKVHESIHIRQQFELIVLNSVILYFIVGLSFWLLLSYFTFYILYSLEYIVKYKKYKNTTYENLSFEREAYANQNNLEYLKTRKLFSFLKYLTINKNDGKA